jgi:hypothetical protein
MACKWLLRRRVDACLGVTQVRLSAGRDQRARQIRPLSVFGLEALAALHPDRAGSQRLEGAMAMRTSVVVRVRSEMIRSAVVELAVMAPRFEHPLPPAALGSKPEDARFSGLCGVRAIA